MKRLVIISGFFFLFALVANAQQSAKEWDFINQNVQQEKRNMVAKFVQLPEEDVFWKLYDEYETKRKKQSEESYRVLLDYAANYVNYSDTKLEEIMNKSIRIRGEMELLLESYYTKIKEQCGIKTASQFWMIQRYFDSSFRANVLGNLPILEK